jgi:hypothetical protein
VVFVEREQVGKDYKNMERSKKRRIVRHNKPLEEEKISDVKVDEAIEHTASTDDGIKIENNIFFPEEELQEKISEQLSSPKKARTHVAPPVLSPGRITPAKKKAKIAEEHSKLESKPHNAETTPLKKRSRMWSFIQF